MLQWILSRHAGTERIFTGHLTVVVVDWVFVPFNYFVVSVIDWRRGGTLFILTIIAVVMNAVIHAFWQYNHIDPGHMITHAGVVLPAGWVHLAFSTLQMILLTAFIFCRKTNASNLGVATALAGVYFVLMGVCGYAIHGQVILSDLVTWVSGLFFVFVYPSLRRSTDHAPA